MPPTRRSIAVLTASKNVVGKGAGIERTPKKNLSGQTQADDKYLAARDFPVERVEPKPTKVLDLPLERALMIANAPRGKLGTLFSAAITGLVGAAPGAAEAVHDSYFGLKATGLSVYGLIEVGLFLVFLVLLVVSMLPLFTKVQTSRDLVEEFYGTTRLSKSKETRGTIKK